MKINLRLLVALVGLLVSHLPFSAWAQSDNIPRPVTICSGANIVIRGDQSSVTSATYQWELYYAGAWMPAVGANNAVDYLASPLLNTGLSDLVFNLRRRTTIVGVLSYDSYYLVTVQPILTIENNVLVAPQVSNYCGSGNPGILTGSTPVAGTSELMYQWQRSSDNQNFVNIDGAFSKDYTPGNLQSTVYFRRIAMTGGCGLASVSNSIRLTIIPSLTGNSIAGPASTLICKNSKPGLIAGSTPSGGTGVYSYQWQQSVDRVSFSNISGATGKDFDPPALSATLYYRRLVTSGACDVINAGNVVGFEVLPDLQAIVPRVEEITRSGMTFVWDAVAGATGYQVSLDQGKTYSDPSSGKTGLKHVLTGLNASQDVSILVKATGQLSCQEAGNGQALTATTLKEFDDIFIPNAFSPNGDGKNDALYVRSEQLKSMRFFIYSQWGEQVFQSFSLAQGWDGTFKGLLAPMGVYVYYLKAVMNNGREFNRKGTITLIR